MAIEKGLSEDGKNLKTRRTTIQAVVVDMTDKNDICTCGSCPLTSTEIVSQPAKLGPVVDSHPFIKSCRLFEKPHSLPKGMLGAADSYFVGRFRDGLWIVLLMAVAAMLKSGWSTKSWRGWVLGVNATSALAAMITIHQAVEFLRRLPIR